MRLRIRSSAFGALVGGLLLATGCGDSHPLVDSSMTEAKVKGVVLIKGKPAQGGGEIRFNPSNVDRKVGAITAKIEEDGSFSLKSFTGGNEVKFSGPFLKDNQQLALASRFCELAKGDNTINFDLLGANDEAQGTMYPQGTKPNAKAKR
jgi:hypothetical protein